MTFTFELNEELLTPIVKNLFGGEVTTIESFSMKALKPGAGNPTSLGVYRVSCIGKVAGEHRTFSLVVKHLANGLPMLDASEPNYWNYWLREISFFESPLVERIPSSIGFPKYLGQSRLDDGTALFWNADLGDLEKTNWTWQDCLLATQLVAELNSIDSSDLNKFDWLNNSQVQGWAELTELWNTFTPVYQRLLDLASKDERTREAARLFGPYLDQQQFIGGILTAGRQSFVHGDFNLNNLVPIRNADVQLVALDWQLCGTARIGTEVAAIFNTAVELGVIQVSDELFDELCAVYTARFNELNPTAPVSFIDVRLAAAAMGYFILQGMGFFFAAPQPEDNADQIAAKIRGLLESYTGGPIMVYSRVLHDLAPLSN